MILYYFIHTTQIGFYTICLLLSRGFYFYFVLLFSILNKMYPCKFFYKRIIYYKEKSEDPTSFLSFLVLVLFFIYMYVSLYVGNSEYKYVSLEENKREDQVVQKKKTDTKEINLYRKYSNYNIDNISFEKLRAINKDVLAWIIVDGTNINYPVVQTNNNDYYLNHDITGNLKGSGWIFMDYRNDINIDKNIIFYGHNLLNKTAFGSVSNIFTNEWLDSDKHKIMIVTETNKYIYEVFSIYYIEPEVYYLQNNFYTSDEYISFLDVLKGRSTFNFNINLNETDKIITLSTCTDDNRGRKVVHAKLIETK